MKLFNKSTKAGFTLVELIVVIAILAILAGVAIPVYSGYIKKANEAADNQLLAAVNTAFGAASLEGGESRPASATATLTDGAVTQVKSTVDADGTAFAKYFAGNEDSKFKVFTNLAYNRATGTFKGAKVSSSTVDGVTTYSYTIDGQTYNVTDTQIAAVAASTYGQNIGMDELMGDVAGMVDSLSSALNNGDFIANIIGSENLAKWGIEKGPDGKYNKDELANAVVLRVAEMVPEGSATGIATMMGDKDTLTGLTTTMQTASVGELVNSLGNITAFYAMATGFASSDAAQDWRITVGEGDDAKVYNAEEYYALVNSKIAAAAADTTVTNQNVKAQNIMKEMAALSNLMITDGNFNSYYSDYIAGGDSSQLNLDAQGFEQAMHAISANQDALAGSGALQTGYNSGDIAGILNMIFGG